MGAIINRHFEIGATPMFSHYCSPISNTMPDVTINITEMYDLIIGDYFRESTNTLRDIQDDKDAKVYKANNFDYVTISGTFTKRGNDNLIDHSGLLVIDLDDLDDIPRIKALLMIDQYLETELLFVSPSGNGLKWVVSIDTQIASHADYFSAIQSYLLHTYQIEIDKSGKDVSRACFLCYDQAAVINPKYIGGEVLAKQKFNPLEWLPKPEMTLVTSKVVNQSNHQSNNLKKVEVIIEKIENDCIDITESYSVWLKIGFAFANEFGENGRQLYHRASRYFSGYDNKDCDLQFDQCLKRNNGEINIGSFFHLAKKAKITPAKDHELAKVDNDFSGINSDLAIATCYVRDNFDLIRNEINGRIYSTSGIELTEVDINTMAINASCLKASIKPATIQTVLGSNFIKTVNPIKEYFEKSSFQNSDVLDKVFASINCDQLWKPYFMKWMVGVVAGVYGKPNPLVLVLIGGQNTGKTRWFRDLLPKSLMSYYGELNNDVGNQKDEYFLFTEKLILLDDEFGNKNKKEVEAFKALTSKATFNLRRPYGRNNEDVNRIASIAGTSNTSDVINDMTGNRRIIPVEIESVDFDLINSIDRDELWCEAYQLFCSEFDTDLTKEEIKVLNEKSEDYSVKYSEEELIELCYSKPGEGFGEVEFLSATQILSDLNYNFRVTGLTKKRVGGTMQKLGFEKKVKRVKGLEKTQGGYEVIINSQHVKRG